MRAVSVSLHAHTGHPRELFRGSKCSLSRLFCRLFLSCPRLSAAAARLFVGRRRIAAVIALRGLPALPLSPCRSLPPSLSASPPSMPSLSRTQNLVAVCTMPLGGSRATPSPFFSLFTICVLLSLRHPQHTHIVSSRRSLFYTHSPFFMLSFAISIHMVCTNSHLGGRFYTHGILFCLFALFVSIRIVCIDSHGIS